MAAELARELEVPGARRSARLVAVRAIGPVTVLAGLVWAAAQPYRVTLLDPRGHGVWDLLVEPPLLVLAVGLLFMLVVAPGLAHDLEEADAAPR
jgi:hypothetical protein